MPTLAPHLAAQITVAEPTVVGPLAVFPLIADRSPSVRYVSFAEAVQRGATVKELGGGASVNDLIVHNPLDAPGPALRGRGGARRPAEPNLRRLGARRRRVRAAGAGQLCRGGPLGRSASRRGVRAGAADSQSAAAPDEEHAGASEPRRRAWRRARFRARSGERWPTTAGRHGVNSRTGAMHDVFERRREQLDAVARAVEMHCSQVGMLAAIGGRFVVLDHVSEVEAFAALHGPLVQGYALDALEASDADAAVDRRRTRLHRAAARRPLHAGPSGRARRGAAVRVRRARRDWPGPRGRARDADRVRRRTG